MQKIAKFLQKQHMAASYKQKMRYASQDENQTLSYEKHKMPHKQGLYQSTKQGTNFYNGLLSRFKMPISFFLQYS